MSRKIVVLLSTLVMLLSGCSNLPQSDNPPNNGVVSNPFNGNVSDGAASLTHMVSYKIGIKGDEARLTGNDKLCVPLRLNGNEGGEKVGVKVYIDGILQEFSPDNSEDYSDNNIMSIKTDGTDYQLEIKAKFDRDFETHTISALSVYNPEFTPQPGAFLGYNHNSAAGAFRTLSISNAQLEYENSTAIYKVEAPVPTSKEQSEKYGLKGEYGEALLLLQNDSENSYALRENGSSVLLQFVAGTQVNGSEKYRVSFYKNHELVPFNGDYFYLDISLEGGKISINDIEIDNVREGDFLYCIAVPTASYNEYAYPQKTDTVVVVSK